MKKLGLIVGLILFAQLSFSQLSYENEQKPHFRIFTNDASVSSLEKFVSVCDEYTDFDQFRLQSERRIIQFQFTEVYIELFSANELELTYGKLISPLTITHGQSYKPLEFYITDENQPKLDVIYLKVPELVYP